MEKQICKTCVHFRQHYIIDNQRCTSIACGHCTFPRLKHRIPTRPACDHYAFRSSPANLPDRNHVVDYLTTELLQYILSLDLPPKEE